MTLDAKLLRKQLHDEHVAISFLQRWTKIDKCRLKNFFDGNDRALTTEELGELDRLLNPDETEQAKNLATNREIIDGIGKSLRGHGVAFLFETRKGALELASGTLTRIGESVIVATAGHVIRQTKMLQFIGENIANFQADIDSDGNIGNVRGGANINVLRYGKHATCDVGFFELEKADWKLLEREPVGLDRLAIGSGEYGNFAVVHGYPSDFARVHISSDERQRGLSVGSITFTQTLLSPDEWPAVPSDARDSNQNVDCFMRYSTAEKMFRSIAADRLRFPVPKDLPTGLPNAPGMSGGGLWQSWADRDSLWNPRDYKLIAIQSSWSKDREYLRATQTQHWLDLVHSECVDLRDPIDEYMKTED